METENFMTDDKNTDTPQLVKKKKTMNPRRSIWQHFEKFWNDQGEIRGRCHYCNNNYTAESSSGTSGLIYYLKKL